MVESPVDLGYPADATLVDTSDVASVPAAFQRTVRRFGAAVAYRTLDDSVRLTWEQVAEQVARWAHALAATGVTAGDTAAIMMTNRPEHLIIDLGAVHLGAACTSIYNSMPPADVAYVLADAGARVVVTEARFADQVRTAVTEHGLRIELLVVLDDPDPAPLTGVEVLTHEQFLARRPPADFHFDAAWRSVRREDVCQIIYTSGTTQRPKGVELSHRSALQSADVYRVVAPLTPGRRLLSAFPLAHVAERVLTYFVPVLQGHCVTFCPDIRKLGAYYLAVRPAYVFLTPRSLERFRSAIEVAIASESDAHRRKAMRHAIDLGTLVVTAEQTGRDPDPEVLEAWQATAALRAEMLAVVGMDGVEYAGVGSAPVSLELMTYFLALGLPAREGYGMTESGAVTALGRLDGPYRVGHCGPPVPNTQIKLAGDGEILVRGPGLMTGYRNHPEQTTEAIDAEGWLHTGDIGAFNELGHLRMVDRKKELIINSNGKNMSPVRIEGAIKNAGSLIGQVLAVGDARPHVSALLTLDPEGLEVHRRRHRIDPATPADVLAEDPTLRAEIQAQIDRANAHLSAVEKVRAWVLLTEEWVPGVELTPTMKLKRRVITAKHADTIEELYR